MLTYSQSISKTRNILGSFFGNISEWYEFVSYGFCAPFLGPLFFPAENPLVSTIAVFAAFAVGFFMRPLGGLIFGHFGDKYGRQKSMVFSIILIGLPTVVMGIIPTYKTMGILAPIILVVVRMLQGLSVGGQFTGAAIFVNEHIGVERKYFGAGINFSAAFVGMLLASAVGALLTSLLSAQQLADWGWRIPFLLGILVTMLGYYLKSHTSETPTFEKMRSQQALSRYPIIDAFTHEWKNMLLSVFICWLTPLIVYQLFIFMPTYINTYLHAPLNKALQTNSIGMMLLSFFTVFFGYLADKVGFKKVMLSASILLTLFAYPLYALLVHNIAMLTLVQTIFAILGGAFIGPVTGVLSGLFSAKTRYTALSFSYNLGFGMFGGTAALVSIFLIERTHIISIPGLYISIAALISTIAVMQVRHQD